LKAQFPMISELFKGATILRVYINSDNVQVQWPPHKYIYVLYVVQQLYAQEDFLTTLADGIQSIGCSKMLKKCRAAVNLARALTIVCPIS
jgi:hypothetical protein